MFASELLARRPAATRLFLLAALLLLGIGCGLLGGPADTVERFHRDISEGKIEDALSLIAPESLQELGRDKVRDLLRSATDDVKKKGGIKVSRIEKEEITGEIATVSIYLEHGDGTSEFHDVDLVMLDGEWKILFKLADK